MHAQTLWPHFAPTSLPTLLSLPLIYYSCMHHAKTLTFLTINLQPTVVILHLPRMATLNHTPALQREQGLTEFICVRMDKWSLKTLFVVLMENGTQSVGIVARYLKGCLIIAANDDKFFYCHRLWTCINRWSIC